MAETPQLPDEAETRARWGAFAWTPENAEKAREIVGRYPPGRQMSASIPFLDLAQRQVGAETNTQGWLPVPVIEFVARELGMSYMRVFEVASFYTMFNMVPVGRYHVQVCGTTPCMLRGSDDVLAACKNRGMHKGHTTADGLFTLTEVECLGVCANAPDGPDQRRQLRGPGLRPDVRDPRCAGQGRGPQPGPADRPAGELPRRRPDYARGNGFRDHDYRGEWA